jgi:L-ascorbate metabolism protein UlaG (beta-lactamase superfamily)
MSISIQKLSRYSWFKINTKNNIIHIDPGYAGYFKTQGIPESELKDKADLILVTHSHKDHLQPEALSKICSSDTIVLAPENCAKRIERNLKIIKPEDELTFEDIKIKVVDAYNTPEGNSTKKFHHKGNGVGYLITLEGKTIYHAGDTDFIPEMEEFGNVAVALVPIGGTFTMDMEEAVDAIMTIKPKIVIPMHMKNADPEEFKKIVEEKSDIKVIPPEIGKVYKLD